jgi:hypothetical protein
MKIKPHPNRNLSVRDPLCKLDQLAAVGTQWTCDRALGREWRCRLPARTVSVARVVPRRPTRRWLRQTRACFVKITKFDAAKQLVRGMCKKPGVSHLVTCRRSVDSLSAADLRMLGEFRRQEAAV